MFENSALFEAFNFDATLWADALRAPNGLFLVAGPTDSGKSTFWDLTARFLEAQGYDVRVTDRRLNASAHKSDLVGREMTASAVKLVNAPPHGEVARFPFELVELKDYRDAVELSRRHLVVTTMHAGSAVGALRRMTDNVGLDDVCDVVRAVSCHSLVPFDENRNNRSGFHLRYPAVQQTFFENPEQVRRMLISNDAS